MGELHQPDFCFRQFCLTKGEVKKVRRLTLRDRSVRPSSGVKWAKSSFSGACGDCVEVASMPGGLVGVRDSKNINGAVLHFAPDEWNTFLRGARNGEFDHFGRSAGS